MSDIETYLDDLEKELMDGTDEGEDGEAVEGSENSPEAIDQEYIDGVNNDEADNDDNQIDDDEEDIENAIKDVIHDDEIDDDELEDGTIFMDAEGNYYYQSGKKAVPVKRVRPAKRKHSFRATNIPESASKKTKSATSTKTYKAKKHVATNKSKPAPIAKSIKNCPPNKNPEKTPTQTPDRKNSAKAKEKASTTSNSEQNTSKRVTRSVTTEPIVKEENLGITTTTMGVEIIISDPYDPTFDEQVFEFEETERNIEDPDNPDNTVETNVDEDDVVPRTTKAVVKPTSSTYKPDASGRFHCMMCDYNTDKKFLLSRHLKTHSEERPFKCSVCERGFKTNISLVNHMNTHTGRKPHQCTDCDKAFTTSGELTRHRRYRHTGIKPHKCTECDYSSVELSKLRRHMCCHTGERPYQCPHCTYASPDTFKLKRHMRTHTGEKPYVCDICQSRFTQSNSLKYHRLIHSVNDKPVFQCNLCPTTCGRKTDLRLHIQKQHNTNTPVPCKRCGKILPDRYSYKMHVKTHDGEKCYRCQLCPYASISQRHLDTHMLLHTDSKPFTCVVCDQRFRQKQLLTRHVKIYHTVNYTPPEPRKKDHCCPHCDRSFAFNGNLIRHMEIHDPNSTQNDEKLQLKLGRMRRVQADGTVVTKAKIPFIYDDDVAANEEIEEEEYEEEEEEDEEEEELLEDGQYIHDDEAVETECYVEETEENVQYVYEEYVNDEETIEIKTDDNQQVTLKDEKQTNSKMKPNIGYNSIVPYESVKNENNLNNLMQVEVIEDQEFMVIEVLREEDEEQENELVEPFETIEMEETLPLANQQTTKAKSLADITADCFGFDDDAEADKGDDDVERDIIQITEEE